MNKNDSEEIKKNFCLELMNFIHNNLGNINISDKCDIKDLNEQYIIDSVREFLMNYVRERKLCDIAKNTIIFIKTHVHKNSDNNDYYLDKSQDEYNNIIDSFDKSVVAITIQFLFNKIVEFNKIVDIESMDPYSTFEFEIIKNHIIELCMNALVNSRKQKENDKENGIIRETIGDPDEILNNVKIALRLAKRENEFYDIKSCSLYLNNLFRKADLYNHIDDVMKYPNNNLNNYHNFKIYENQILDCLTLFCILLQINTDTKIRDYERLIYMILYESPAIVYGVLD